MTQRKIEVSEFTCDGLDADDGGHCGARVIHEGAGRPHGWIELPSGGPRYSGGVAEPNLALTFCGIPHFIGWLSSLHVIFQGYGTRTVGSLVAMRASTLDYKSLIEHVERVERPE